MPCGCSAGTCKTCKCGKKGKFCTAECHGGQNAQCINFDGSQFTPNPLTLSAGALRKALSGRGLSPMGTKNEMILRLRDALLTEKGGGDERGGGGESKNDILTRVIELGDQMDYEGILSLAGAEITSQSAVGAMKKAYRLLSIKCHPDKNGNSADSKKAFQFLVSAYERLTKPEQYEEEESSSRRAAPKKISRSNQGCYKTIIHCPRCNMDWGRKELGLEDGAYNWFMMGIREYSCGRCLLSFGCMTARHRCPHCKKDFDYDPKDYHRKIVCGNPKCNRPFGFMLYHVSNKREREVRKEQKALVEKLLKKRERLRARAKRATDRGVGSSIKAEGKEKESLFVRGLLDTCPRCGKSISEMGFEARKYPVRTAKEHLRSCIDKAKHKRYQKQLQSQQKEKEAKNRLIIKQEEQILLSSWEMQGSRPGQLWTLTYPILQRLCERYGLEGKGSRTEMIKRVGEYLRSKTSSLLLTDGSEKGMARGTRKRIASEPIDEDLPSNLQELTTAQLRAICASHGIACSSRARKMDLINAIDKKRLGKQAPLLLTGTNEKPKKKKRRKAARKKRMDAFEDEDDADYVPGRDD